MTNHPTAEYPHNPESEFGQTIGYLQQLLDEHGRPPVEGEIGADAFTRQMQIDPAGKDPERAGYILHDVHIAELPDGKYRVYNDYNTRTLDPATEEATNTYWYGRWLGAMTDMKPKIRELDDEALRELRVTISDAMENGTVVEQKPIFPGGPLSGLTRAVRERLGRP